MGIEYFNNSVFNNFFSYNEEEVHIIADSLYRKIKKSGILPAFIEREKRNKIEIDITLDITTAIVTDLDFSYGVAITGAVLAFSPAFTNLSNVHTIAWEYSGDLTPTFVYGTGAWTATFSPVFAVAFNKIEVRRNHLVVEWYVNGVLDQTDGLGSDDKATDMYNLFDHALTEKVGNIKVTRADTILYWWKCNFYASTVSDGAAGDFLIPYTRLVDSNFTMNKTYFIVGGSTRGFGNTGNDSDDFYSFWYTVAFFYSIIIYFSRQVLDIGSSVSQMKRFLASKGLYIYNKIGGLYVSSSDVEATEALYGDWHNEFKRRGTEQVFLRQNTNRGRARKMLIDASLQLESAFTTDWQADMSFDLKILDSTDTDISIFNGFLNITGGVSSPSGTVYTFISGEDVGLTTVVTLNQDVKYNIRIVRTEGEVFFLYIDNEIEYYLAVPASVGDITTVDVVKNDAAAGEFLIGNLRMEFPIPVYSALYPLNEKYTLYSESINLESIDILTYVFTAAVTEPYTLVDTIFENDDDFDNLLYLPDDGEILRGLDYDDGDVIDSTLFNHGELGMHLTQSSFLSTQTYPNVNLNKFFNQNEDILDISKIPLLAESEDVLFSVNDTELTDKKVLEISFSPPGGVAAAAIIAGTHIDQYLEPNDNFFIPVDFSSDYEISFRIKADTDVDLKFGVDVFDSQKNRMDVKSALTGGTLSGSSIYFLDGVWKYTGDWIWIRAILYNAKSTVAQVPGPNYTFSQLPNIGEEQNLVMEIGARYICPVIDVTFPAGAYANKKAFIYDINVLPLSLPFQKGIVGSGNTMLNYLKNNTGREDDVVSEEFKNALLPYNVNIFNKFL